MVEGGRPRDGERASVVMGFDIHAGAVIDGRDRPRVERLCRYLARPPIAQERLVEIASGKLRYELKKAWRDGTQFVIFEPHELLARVCAMIPPPRFHMIRFHGVLAPNAALRRHVVASARPSALAVGPDLATLKTPGIEQLSLFGQMEAPSCFDVGKMRRKPWAWLLRHVFAIDVSVCPECSGKMRWRAVALTPEAIAEGLARAGFSARGPPRRPRAPKGQLSLPFPR